MRMTICFLIILLRLSLLKPGPWDNTNPTWALSVERQTITVPHVRKLHSIKNKEPRVESDSASSNRPLEGLHCLLSEVPTGFYRGGCSKQLTHLIWWINRMSDSTIALQLIQRITGDENCKSPYVFPRRPLITPAPERLIFGRSSPPKSWKHSSA